MYSSAGEQEREWLPPAQLERLKIVICLLTHEASDFLKRFRLRSIKLPVKCPEWP
jgi:hypothetical protein